MEELISHAKENMDRYPWKRLEHSVLISQVGYLSKHNLLLSKVHISQLSRFPWEMMERKGQFSGIPVSWTTSSPECQFLCVGEEGNTDSQLRSQSFHWRLLKLDVVKFYFASEKAGLVFQRHCKWCSGHVVVIMWEAVAVPSVGPRMPGNKCRTIQT